jgi:hypothetical protein
MYISIIRVALCKMAPGNVVYMPNQFRLLLSIASVAMAYNSRTVAWFARLSASTA